MTKPFPSRMTPVRNQISPTLDHQRRPAGHSARSPIVPRRFPLSAASTILLPLVAVLLSGVLSSASAQSAEYLFDRQEIDIGPALRQTVLTGFLLGGDVADLAVVKIEEDGGRSVRVFAFAGGSGEEDGSGQDEGPAKDEGPVKDEGVGKGEGSGYDEGSKENGKRASPRTNGTWQLKVDARLRSGVTFVDVARIGGRDRLITGEPDRLNAWDPDTETEYGLVSVASGFQAPREGEVPHVDVTRDVNGDGRIDLVVPGADGFHVFVQVEDGAFADPVVIGPPSSLDPILGADGYRYDPWSVSRVHPFDYNGDGRVDLVSWNGARFEAHLQDGQGLFDPEPAAFTTDARFDSDDFTMLATGDMTGRVLHSFTDMNRDGIADLVIYALEGAKIAEKRSAYEVHFGARGSDGRVIADGRDRSNGGVQSDGRVRSDGRAQPDDRAQSDGRVQFSSEVDVSIQTDGNIQLAMERVDLGRDCEPGLVVTSIERKYLESSLFKRIKGFMGDDVWLNLAFYRMEAGRAPVRPAATRRIQLDGAPSPREPGWVPLDVVLLGGRHALRNDRGDYRRAFNKNRFIGDVTGNGRSDLLLEWTHRELHVYAGVPGPELFAEQPRKVAVELPNDGEYAWMSDLNGDGRQDIVMHRLFTKRDAHGAPMELPGAEPHRVTLLIAR